MFSKQSLSEHVFRNRIFVSFVHTEKKQVPICFVLVLLTCAMTSCWTIRTVTVTDYPQLRTDNPYAELKGKIKQQVLTALSAPNKVVDDGMGGEILMYESVQRVTEDNSSGKVITEDLAVYDTKSHAIDREYKSYVHVFINDSNMCYHVNAEVYTQASTHNECYKYPSDMSALLACIAPPLGSTIWLIWYCVNKKHPKRTICVQ